jgi:hypothetical protein
MTVRDSTAPLPSLLAEDNALIMHGHYSGS